MLLLRCLVYWCSVFFSSLAGLYVYVSGPHKSRRINVATRPANYAGPAEMATATRPPAARLPKRAGPTDKKGEENSNRRTGFFLTFFIFYFLVPWLVRSFFLSSLSVPRAPSSYRHDRVPTSSSRTIVDSRNDEKNATRGRRLPYH